MSKAFTKEQDTAIIEGLPNRPISEHPNDVTAQGADQIDAKLAAWRDTYRSAESQRPYGLGCGLSRYTPLVLAKSHCSYRPASRKS